MACSGGVCESRGAAPSSSSSSSSSPSFLPIKSSGPLCSCAPPYCVTCQREARLAQLSIHGREAYILVPANGLVDVARRELVQLLVVAKDDDGHVDGAEHRELMRLLEQAAFALQKGAVQGQCWFGHARRVEQSSGGRAYTERLRSSLMALISILRRPMVTVDAQAERRIRRRHKTPRGRCTGMRGDVAGVEGSSRNKRSLVLACAAAAVRAADHEHVQGFRRPASGKGRRAGCVEQKHPRLGHYLYVCDVRNGAPRQHSQYLEALGVMCKRKRSWSGRRS
jgi:hypothetical protein